MHCCGADRSGEEQSNMAGPKGVPIGSRLILRLGSAVIAVALGAMVVGVSAYAATRAIVRTDKPISSFAQSRSTIAWRVRGSDHIRLRNLQTGAHRYLVMFPPPSDPIVCFFFEPAGVRGIAVGGTRAIWRWEAYAEGSGCSEDAITYHAVSSVAIGDASAVSLMDWGQPYCPVDASNTMYIGAVDASGPLAAYSTIHQGCPGGVATGQVTLVANGTQTPIAGSPPAARLAADTGRVAWIAAAAATKLGQLGEPRGGQPAIAPNTPIEVYDTTTSMVVTSVTPRGRVRSIALSGDILAALVRRPSGAQVIVRYHVHSRERIGSTSISPKASGMIDMAGSRIVFTNGNHVRLMNAITGHTRLLATTPSPPRFFSIAGRRVAWVSNTRHAGAIIAVNVT